MKKILLYISIISVMFFGYACSELDSDLADQGDKVNAAFPVATSSLEVKSTDGGTLKVKVVRGNTRSDADVGITLKTGEGVPASANFRLASNTVHFAKGENTAEIAVNYAFDELEPFQTYPIEFSFTDANQGPLYGALATTKLNVRREVVYSDYGVGQFVSEFFEQGWSVELQKADGAAYFIMKDCYVEGYPIYFALNQEMNQVIEFDEKQETGYVEAGLGMVSVSLLNYSISGKEVTFRLRFYIPDGRYFNSPDGTGTYKEVITLP